MQYEAPAVEDLGSIADHTFTHPQGFLSFPFDLLARLGLGSAPS